MENKYQIFVIKEGVEDMKPKMVVLDVVKVYDFMTKKGMTRKQFEEKVGLCNITGSKALNEKEIAIGTAARIALVLGCGIMELLLED